jgi:hypothetical protein
MPKTPSTKTKVEKVSAPTVTLMNYTIKAVIPTGPYANVQPEITVSAPSLAEAKDYVLPHIDELFEKYLNLSDRPKPRVVDTTPVKQVTSQMAQAPVHPASMSPAQALATPPMTSSSPLDTPMVVTHATTSPEVKTVVLTPELVVEPTTPAPVVTPEPTTPAPVEAEPVKVATAFDKAKMALESCKSVEALNLIAEKIEQSIKLDALDKADLSVLVKVKHRELVG